MGNVTQWTPFVVSELNSQGVPLPKELILELIRIESGGHAGAVNPKSGASGLMQVMPITLTDYNQRHGTGYTLADMRGKTTPSAVKQLRVGLSTLAHYWRRAYKYLRTRMQSVPIDELAHVADLYYVAGPGATQKRLDKLYHPTWSSIKSAYPNWNALPHPQKVLEKPKPWDLDAIGPWLESAGNGLSKIVKDPKTGFALGILLLMAIYWWMKRGGKNE